MQAVNGKQDSNTTWVIIYNLYYVKCTYDNDHTSELRIKNRSERDPVLVSKFFHHYQKLRTTYHDAYMCAIFLWTMKY